MLDLPVAGLRHHDEEDHDMAHNNLMLVVSEAEAEAAWWETTGYGADTFFAMKEDGRE